MINLSLTYKREIRKFGIIAFLFFGTLCGVGIWTHKAVPAYLFGTLSTLGIGFILLPGPMAPVHRGWMKIAHFIGTLVTGLILALAYYLVITPAGFIKRIFGGVPLPTVPDKKAASYWVERTEPAQPKERFEKRF